MPDKPTIIDSQGNLEDYQPETGLEVMQTILPYFPDDERMGNYLCYVASGWTRNKALIRAGATQTDLQEWREDSRFLEIDSLGYNELRKEIANLYAERITRRNVIQLLEFDNELFETVREKITLGIELTKDERAFALKRAGIYGVETLATLDKLLNRKNNEEEDMSGQVFDFMAFVMRRRSA